MRDWLPEFHRVLAGQRDDLRELLGAELARRAAALPIGERVDNQLLKLRVGRLLGPFGVSELRVLVPPPMAPAQNPLRIHTERRSLLDRRAPRGRPQHDLNPLGESPLGRSLAAQPLEDRALPR